MISYAQNLEDVLLARVFSRQETGVYVDIGAGHPVELSVTKHFYDHGWRGVNVEPIARNHALLVAARPRDLNLRVAVGREAGARRFFECEDFDALSTFDAAQAGYLRAQGHSIREYDVETVRCDTVVEAAGGAVDFLKVDVEGLEGEVLASLDLRRHRPKVLVVESTRPARAVERWWDFDTVATWHEWEPRVLAAGYRFAWFDGVSRFYVREESSDLLPAFSVPVGYFDHFRFPPEAPAEAPARDAFADAVAEDPAAAAMPRITLVTPVLNLREHVAETLESVLRQPYPDLEYIVVDGGSTDGTLDVVRDYARRTDLPQRIARIVSEPDEGLYDAVAKGFARGTGEVLAYLNADDLLEPGGLLAVGRFFAATPRAKALFHEDTVIVNGWKYANAPQPRVATVEDFLGGLVLYQAGVFVRRELYEAVGGVRRELRVAGDYDLWLRMSAAWTFVRGEGHVSTFRIRRGQLSTDMAKYNAEMARARADFLRGAVPRLRWRLRSWATHARERLRHGAGRDPLFFPLDFENQSGPPALAAPASARPARSPVDGRHAERFMLTVVGTQAGVPEMAHVYWDIRHRIAITWPPRDAGAPGEAQGRLPVRANAPSLDSASPFRTMDRRTAWDRLLLRLPLGGAGDEFDDSTEARTRRALERWGIAARGRASRVLDLREHALDAVPPHERFDLIHSHAALSYADDPLRLLARLRRLLAPGGAIVVALPNLDSRLLAWHGPFWARWDVPSQRHVFSPRGLRALAARAGLRARHGTTFSCPYWTALTLARVRAAAGQGVDPRAPFDPATRTLAARIEAVSRMAWNRRGLGDTLLMVLVRSGDG